MAKEPRKVMSGKEARYILKQNSVNLAWLSEKLGIKPQTLNSRLNAEEFKKGYMYEINEVLGKDVAYSANRYTRLFLIYFRSNAVFPLE